MANCFSTATSKNYVTVHLTDRQHDPKRLRFYPGIDDYEIIREMRVVKLEPLVRMKLDSFRRLDQVNFATCSTLV